VLIENNIFENNWADAQNGFAILFTPRNGGGTAPWNVVQDITFRRNIVRHSSSGVNILGTDPNHPTQQTKRILIQDNLFEDISNPNWGGQYGSLFQLLDGTADVVIDHNTGIHDNYLIFSGSGAAHTGFVYTNNIAPHNQEGVTGSGTGTGFSTLNAYFPGLVFARNVLAGGNSSNYPVNNFFPSSLSSVGFVNLGGGDYRLAASSPYNNAATDGTDVGADLDSLLAVTASVVNGITTTNPPAPPPPPSDSTAPTISAVSVPLVSTSTATVTWSTNESSDSQVEYGTTTSYGASTSLIASMVISHMQNLSGLSPNRLYHYRVKSKDGAGNTAVSSDGMFTTLATSGTSSPFSGVPIAVPAVFQAEDFDNGGEGVAYHDAVPGNAGGAYRSEDVDIVAGGTGYVVNNIQTGEWLSYSINVAQTGTYRIEASVTSGMTASGFHIEIDGVDKTGSVTVPNSGSWSAFQWAGVGGVSLSAGAHTLKIVSEQEYFDLDAIQISTDTVTSPPPPPAPAPVTDTTAPVISLVSVSALSASGGTISWKTDELSNSQIEYGTTSAYGSATAINPNMVISHSMALSGLKRNTVYHYRLKSRDAAGNLTVTKDYTFRTKKN
ncbi:MAG TPA: carbohydrate-binding protein, partial [Candidatus Binatia bacterium]